MTRESRFGLASLICLSLAAMLVLAADACPETIAMVGVGATRGMGERTAAPESSLTFSGRYFAAEANCYLAQKIESGKGWGVHGAAELRWRWVGAGLSYSYRDGGPWSKNYPWARVSLGTDRLRLVGDFALGGVNHERKLEARATARLGHLVIGPRVFIESHAQGTGFGSALFVGLAI